MAVAECFVKCCCVCSWEYSHQSETQDSHGVFAKNTQLPARQTMLDTDRHTTATPLCGPTRYDLHLRDGTERKRMREKTKRAGQRGNAADRTHSCLF